MNSYHSLLLCIQIKRHLRVLLYIFRRRVVISYVLVYLCDRSHILIGQFKIKDVEVVTNVRRILRSGEYYISVLNMLLNINLQIYYSYNPIKTG